MACVERKKNTPDFVCPAVIVLKYYKFHTVLT